VLGGGAAARKHRSKKKLEGWDTGGDISSKKKNSTSRRERLSFPWKKEKGGDAAKKKRGKEEEAYVSIFFDARLGRKPELDERKKERLRKLSHGSRENAGEKISPNKDQRGKKIGEFPQLDPTTRAPKESVSGVGGSKQRKTITITGKRKTSVGGERKHLQKS